MKKIAVILMITLVVALAAISCNQKICATYSKGGVERPKR